jgi:branched-chain amino acid transport system substrate-binding protein
MRASDARAHERHDKRQKPHQNGRNNTMKLRLLGSSLALATAAGLPGYGPIAFAQAPAGEPIKFGAVLSVTGVGAGLGVNERNGLILAEKTINAKGGLNGRPIRITIEDDTSNPDTAVTKVNDLIFNQKVIAIFGGSLLGPSVAMGGITDTAKLPQLTFTGLGPAVERTRKCVFHLLPPHELNARALFEYGRSINAKKVGVLHDTGYGNVVMRELNNVAGDYKDVQFIGLEKYEMAATDATAQAAKLRAAQPDAFFVIGTTATPFRAIRQLQMKQPIVAVNGASSYEVVSAMGNVVANDIIYPEFVVNEDPLPNQKEFVELFRKEMNGRAKNFEAAAWDAVQIAMRALGKVGPDAGGPKLCEAMREPYSGVMASYNFTADDMTGIGLSSFVFSKLVNGTYTRTPFRISK